MSKPTFERDTGNHGHEWSTPSRSDNTTPPKHYRVFVSIDPSLGQIITIDDSQVTSKREDARRIEGTSRSVSLTTEELEWILEKGPEILAELAKRWDALLAESTPIDSIEIGLDGNCAYALLGEDLHIGEAVFVRINEVGDRTDAARVAATAAYNQLCRRFKKRLPYRFAEGYPKDGGARDLSRTSGNGN